MLGLLLYLQFGAKNAALEDRKDAEYHTTLAQPNKGT
jgi:hypothetical protein